MNTLDKPRPRDEIIRRLRKLSAENPRRWGKMSAHQMICHLNDSFRCMMGERPASAIRYRRIIMWPALYLPVTWPKGFETPPELDQRTGGTRPSDFAFDLRDLLGLVERFVSSTPDFTLQPHPIFGPFSHWQGMRWGYLHTDHHLRQFGE